MITIQDNPLLLQQFEVKGYKNLTEPIVFGPLGQINVIHGPNNVGKSNLLQAMDLFFKLRELSSKESGADEITKTSADFAEWGHPINEIFNLNHLDEPIFLTATFALTSEQNLEKFFDFRIELHRTIDDKIRIKYPMNLNDMPIKSWAKFINWGIKQLRQGRKPTNPFALVGVNRHFFNETTPFHQEPDKQKQYSSKITGKYTTPNLPIIPQQLRDDLFDAKESPEALMTRRWELFIEAMKQFEPILGSGRFDTAFSRQLIQADLVFDKGNVRIPVDLLGSGVQQVIALLGQLLLTPAPLVGVEEPELNLRYTLQKQLLAAFEQITTSEYGPQQLFLTSHSPAFESEPFFFAMDYSKNGSPTLTRRPRQEARLYTGTRDEEDRYPQLQAQQPEPTGYVSSEGLVLLPEQVRQHLKLQHGGGLNFIPNKETGRFELWTTDELDQWWSGDNPDAHDG